MTRHEMARRKALVMTWGWCGLVAALWAWVIYVLAAAR